VLRGDAVIPWGEAGGLRCVPDVPAALKRLERYGATLGFHLGSAEPVGGLRRHWQGVQRSVGSNGTHLFVSRSGSRTAVLVATLGSGSGGGGALGPSLLHPENVADGEAPPYADRVVTRIPFDSGFNHAGGLALSGTVLAVPMDGGGRSQVAFYDMSLPAQPRRLGVLDHSDAPRYSTPSQASAVALGRLADGRNLLILGV
jgi:hypothetical protein